MSPGRRPLVSAANPARTASITARPASQRACKSDRAGTIRGEVDVLAVRWTWLSHSSSKTRFDNRHEGIKRSGSFNLTEVVPTDLLPIYGYVLEIGILVAEGIQKELEILDEVSFGELLISFAQSRHRCQKACDQTSKCANCARSPSHFLLDASPVCEPAEAEAGWAGGENAPEPQPGVSGEAELIELAKS